jgi:tRNA(Leu) C34 or U34 (ribose-2'-O)-methylase TrmL
MKPKHHAIIALTNPQSPSNVGAVLRSVGCFNAQEILYSGNRYNTARKYHTDTQNTASTVPVKHCMDFFEAKSPDTKVICVDLVEGATPLSDFEHPNQAMYIFGPEDGSVSQAVIDRADATVYIPTIGCLNLAQTVNLVLYDRATKLGLVKQGDAQIVESRDRNNATSVKKP